MPESRRTRSYVCAYRGSFDAEARGVSPYLPLQTTSRSSADRGLLIRADKLRDAPTDRGSHSS